VEKLFASSLRNPEQAYDEFVIILLIAGEFVLKNEKVD